MIQKTRTFIRLQGSFLIVVLLVLANTALAKNGACPVQPEVRAIVLAGGPFKDCGSVDSLRIPHPTKMKHGLHEVSGYSACILPSFKPATWAFPNLPEIEVSTSNMIYRNSGKFPGDVVFTGQTVVFENIQGGRVVGQVLCGAGARNIEYNGECICP